MEEKKVLLEEEINKITSLRKRYSDLTEVVGNVEMQIMSLEIQKEKVKLKIKCDQGIRIKLILMFS